MVAVQVLMMLGYSQSNPLLPLFLEKDLGLSRGRLLELWAGLIAAASFLTGAIFSPIWGDLADRYGRRIMVLRSTSAVAFFSILTVFVTQPYQLLGIRLAMGCLSGFNATAVALLASVTPPNRLGYALGLLTSGQVIGGIIGPLAGGMIGGLLGYRAAFGSTSVLCFMAFLLAATMVKEAPARPEARQPRQAEPSLFGGILVLARSPDLAPMFVVLLVTTLAIGSITPVLAIFVGELNVPASAVPTVAGLAFSVAGIGGAITAPVAGRLADRIGYRPVLVACMAGAALIFVPHALAKTAEHLIAVRLALGLFSGCIIPIANTLVGHLAPPGRQSAAYGLTFSATSLGSFMGPLVGGMVAGAWGIRSVFLVTAALIGLNIFWVVLRVRTPGQRREARQQSVGSIAGEQGGRR